MKLYIIITMIISTVIFWLIMLVAFIYALSLKKRDYDNYKDNDLYGRLCMLFNLICGFLLFEVFSFSIGVYIKSIIMNIILHFPAWYVSMWTAQWIFPRIVNRLVGVFVKPDK